MIDSRASNENFPRSPHELNGNSEANQMHQIRENLSK